MTESNRQKLALANDVNGALSVLLYIDSLAEPSAREDVERVVKRFASCLPSMPLPEKARLIYDVITREVRYATDYNTSKRRFTWYAALLEGQAVCEGIAQLFFKLCAAAGVECSIIRGTACDLDGSHEELHA